MNTKLQIAKNFLSSWVYKILKLVLSLVLIPILITDLGKEDYGIIILVGSILAFGTLIEFGLRTSLVHFFSVSIAQKDYQRFNGFFSTGLILYLGFFAVVSSVLLVFAPQITAVFTDNPGSAYDAVLLLRTYGVGTLLISFITPVFGAIISSHNRYDFSNYRTVIIESTSILTLIVAIKYFGVGLYGWAVISFIFKVITFTVIMLFALRLVPQLKLSRGFFDRATVKELFGFGIITFIGGVSRKMKIDADPMILSAFLGPASLPIYRSGVSMPAHARPLVSTLTGQIHVVSTAFYAQGEKEKFFSVYEKGTKYTLLIEIPVLILFTLFAYPILNLWLGNALSPAEIEIAMWCMIGMALVDFCFYLEGSSYAILYAMKRLKLMTFTDLLLGVSNLTASILILKYTDYGIPGVIFPTIVIEFIARPIYLFYTAGVMGYSRKRILPAIYIPVAKVMGLTFLAAYLVKSLIPPSNLFWLLTNILIYGLIWLALSWRMGLNSKDREDILGTLKIRRNA